MPLYFLARTLQIVVLFPAFVVVMLVARIVRPSSGPTILRRYLQGQGGVFVKLGQFLAMRYDVLPAEYCAELSKLLDRLPPLPVARIVSVIENDLGRPVAELFGEIDPEPLGSASIAQVHRATLLDGRPVAIKVMRPGVRRQFEVDFLYMRLLGTILEEYLFFTNSGIGDIVKEVLTLTREELDFRREAGNIAEMHARMLEDDIDHYAPEVVPGLCGSATITMEFISGVPVVDLLEASDANDQVRLAEWAPLRITPQRTARLILRSVLEQTMRHRLFQCDPHAANLVVMPGGTLGWLDFGILGWLDEKLWKQQYELREAVSEERVHRAFEIVVEMFAPVPKSSIRSFEADVKGYLRDWIRASRMPMASLADKSAGLFFLNVMGASRRANIQMPIGLTRLFRAIIIADIVVLKLDPALDWMPIMQGFIRDEQRRQTIELVHESASLPYAAKAVRLWIGAVPTLVRLTEWIDSSVPSLGREYQAQLTYLESTILVLFRYARIAAIVGTAIALIRLVAVDDAATVGERVLWTVAGLVTVFVLTKLVRIYR
jgi:ubiquinone biosynthesis protein